MADYIFKNSDILLDLLLKAGLEDFPELRNVSNTQELRLRIESLPNSDKIIERITKFFILEHIYDYSGKLISDYNTAIGGDLNNLLGDEPAHNSVFVQRKSKLKFPFKIWTKRTTILQFSIIVIWLILLIWLYLAYPEIWIFTFHLPISGIAIVFLPAVLLTMILPKILGQEKFENISNLQQLVDEVYSLNTDRIYRDELSYLNEELNRYVNDKSP